LDSFTFIQQFSKVHNVRPNGFDVEMPVALYCHFCPGNNSGFVKFILFSTKLFSSCFILRDNDFKVAISNVEQLTAVLVKYRIR
jgi:hypothetical protein